MTDDDFETYTRTIKVETPVLTAKKAGLLNRAMKDYLKAREYATKWFHRNDVFDFNYDQRESLRKLITRKTKLPSRPIYPAITTVEQNYKEFEKDSSADEPVPQRADTLGLERYNTYIFYDDGYYLNIDTGTKKINVPLDVSDSAYHQDRLPLPKYIPPEGRTRLGASFADLEAGNFPKDTVRLSTSTISKVGERRFVANLTFQIKKRVSRDLDAEDARYVVGVDRGRNQLASACLYDREENHVVDWWSRKGDEVEHYMDRFAERIREFQSDGVWKEMEKARQKRYRYKEQVDHEIANSIVDLAREKLNTAIVLEDLGDMSGLGNYSVENRRFNHWSYARLRDLIEEKADPYDIPVVDVEPAYTSQECSRCGSRQTDRDSIYFECRDCGYTQHADSNASVNIAKGVTSSG